MNIARLQFENFSIDFSRFFILCCLSCDAVFVFLKNKRKHPTKTHKYIKTRLNHFKQIFYLVFADFRRPRPFGKRKFSPFPSARLVYQFYRLIK